MARNNRQRFLERNKMKDRKDSKFQQFVKNWNKKAKERKERND